MEGGTGLRNGRNQASSGGLQNWKKGLRNFSFQEQPSLDMAARGIPIASVTTILLMKTASKHHCCARYRAGGTNLVASCHTLGIVKKTLPLYSNPSPNPSQASLGRGHFGIWDVNLGIVLLPDLV